MSDPETADDARAARREADRQRAIAAVEELRSSAGWARWLRARSLLNRYSLRNQLLIAHQHPTATHVAGFDAWRQLGYRVKPRPADVKPGEYQIKVWARCEPSRKQLERWQAAGADPDQRPQPYYRTVGVFAQDQVEPDPAKEQAPLELPLRDLAGDDAGWALGPLVDLARTRRYSVRFEATGDHSWGFLDPAARRIVIDPMHPFNTQVKVLCHELAHMLIRTDQTDAPALSYAQEELLVESVAFIVVRGLGLDASEFAIPYMADWAQSADLDELAQAAGRVDLLAAMIEAALHPADAQGARL